MFLGPPVSAKPDEKPPKTRSSYGSIENPKILSENQHAQRIISEPGPLHLRQQLGGERMPLSAFGMPLSSSRAREKVVFDHLYQDYVSSGSDVDSDAGFSSDGGDANDGDVPAFNSDADNDHDENFNRKWHLDSLKKSEDFPRNPCCSEKGFKPVCLLWLFFVIIIYVGLTLAWLRWTAEKTEVEAGASLGTTVLAAEEELRELERQEEHVDKVLADKVVVDKVLAGGKNDENGGGGEKDGGKNDGGKAGAQSGGKNGAEWKIQEQIPEQDQKIEEGVMQPDMKNKEKTDVKTDVVSTDVTNTNANTNDSKKTEEDTSKNKSKKLPPTFGRKLKGPCVNGEDKELGRDPVNENQYYSDITSEKNCLKKCDSDTTVTGCSFHKNRGCVLYRGDVIKGNEGLRPDVQMCQIRHLGAPKKTKKEKELGLAAGEGELVENGGSVGKVITGSSGSSATTSVGNTVATGSSAGGNTSGTTSGTTGSASGSSTSSSSSSSSTSTSSSSSDVGNALPLNWGNGPDQEAEKNILAQDPRLLNGQRASAYASLFGTASVLGTTSMNGVGNLLENIKPPFKTHMGDDTELFSRALEMASKGTLKDTKAPSVDGAIKNSGSTSSISSTSGTEAPSSKAFSGAFSPNLSLLITIPVTLRDIERTIGNFETWFNDLGNDVEVIAARGKEMNTAHILVRKLLCEHPSDDLCPFSPSDGKKFEENRPVFTMGDLVDYLKKEFPNLMLRKGANTEDELFDFVSLPEKGGPGKNLSAEKLSKMNQIKFVRPGCSDLENSHDLFGVSTVCRYMFSWMLAEKIGAKWLLQTDDDTFVRPDKIKEMGKEAGVRVSEVRRQDLGQFANTADFASLRHGSRDRGSPRLEDRVEALFVGGGKEGSGSGSGGSGDFWRDGWEIKEAVAGGSTNVDDGNTGTKKSSQTSLTKDNTSGTSGNSGISPSNPSNPITSSSLPSSSPTISSDHPSNEALVGGVEAIALGVPCASDWEVPEDIEVTRAKNLVGFCGGAGQMYSLAALRALLEAGIGKGFSEEVILEGLEREMLEKEALDNKAADPVPTEKKIVRKGKFFVGYAKEPEKQNSQDGKQNEKQNSQNEKPQPLQLSPAQQQDLNARRFHFISEVEKFTNAIPRHWADVALGSLARSLDDRHQSVLVLDPIREKFSIGTQGWFYKTKSAMEMSAIDKQNEKILALWHYLSLDDKRRLYSVVHGRVVPKLPSDHVQEVLEEEKKRKVEERKSESKSESKLEGSTESTSTSKVGDGGKGAPGVNVDKEKVNDAKVNDVDGKKVEPSTTTKPLTKEEQEQKLSDEEVVKLWAEEDRRKAQTERVDAERVDGKESAADGGVVDGGQAGKIEGGKIEEGQTETGGK